jgi:hypothetical protein
MRARLHPPSFSVEQMVSASDGVEIAVGGRNDSRLGPLVLVGTGGVFTEIIADYAVELAPVDPERAEELIRGLRAAPILDGVRGRPHADVAALASVVAAVSDTLAAYPQIAELDVNPVIVTPSSAVAVDARIIRL